jgi:succinyl-diaminopimelate desuccinylase
MNYCEKQALTFDLSCELLARPSVTPCDEGCQALIAQRLEKVGFKIKHLPIAGVDNLWAIRSGTKPGPLFVFAGHTDVVPPGDVAAWTADPFVPTCRADHLFARGAVDMKSAVASMVVASERFIHEHADYAGSIALLLTSDEEGDAVHGTQAVLAYLQEQGVHIDYCLVGEPSSKQVVGDQLRVGRRGSLHGHLVVHGTQGHVAYPHLADNAIHRALEALTPLLSQTWCEGNDLFPPTSFQLVSLQGGGGASNVIPGACTLRFNFRFSPCVSVASLKADVIAHLDRCGLRYTVDWRVSALPFYTEDRAFQQLLVDCVRQVTQKAPRLSTAGGTSDARFFALHNIPVLELGHCHHSAHAVDESVKIEDLETLTRIYQGVLGAILQ